VKPRKQSNAEYIIAALTLLAALFLSAKAGMALSDKAVIESAQEAVTEGIDSFNLFFDCFNAQVTVTPLSFVWNDNVKNSLLLGGLLWFIAAAYWFTSKKKYIMNKEYGTAEWSKEKNISDLFAVNLMNKEIKLVKQVRWIIGRYFARKKAYKTCRENRLKIKTDELRWLEQWKSDNTPRDKNLTHEQKKQKKEILRQYKIRKSEIEKKAKEYLKKAFIVAWEPENLKHAYRLELKNIDFRYQQKTAISTESQKKAEEKAEEKAAKVKYKKGLREFYRGTGKIEKIRKKYENADALFTKTERISIYNYLLNNNTLVLGGSGSGKTRAFVMPNILQAHSSFVVTDPKGEILEKAGHFLETVKGYKIHVLNLDEKSRSDGYNPFVYIHPERQGYEERVLMLIEAIIINTDGGEKKTGSDPFWDKAERLFLQAIFFFTCDGFVPEEQTMNTVLTLIGMLQLSEEEDNHDSDLDYFADIFRQKHGEEHIGVQQYKEFREKASGKTAKSIVISAVARLAPFRTSAVRRIFSYDSMCLERLGEEKSAVFVVVPPTDSTFNFIAGMLFTQMFQELQYCATQVHKHDGQRLPVPVRFILDEFANTCTIPHFVKILAYARSFGIGIVPILQSLEQIKNMYKDEWGVIVDNCNTLLYLGSITHMDTLEYMSKLLGKGTFDKKTTGRTRGKSGSSSQNYDVIGRDLLDPAEIRKLPKSDCLLVVGGRNPFYSEKYDYPAHPNYKYTSDASHTFSYEYMPKEPKSKTPPALEVHHRDNEMEQRINERVQVILERTWKETDEIQMSNNEQSLLNHMGQEFVHFAPIRDELLYTDEGTEETAEEEDLSKALTIHAEDEKFERRSLSNIESMSAEADKGCKFERRSLSNIESMSAEADQGCNNDEMHDKVQKHVMEVMESVKGVMQEEGYSVTSDPAEVAKMVLDSRTNLTPISDELLYTDEGTDVTVEEMETTESFTKEEYEFDSDHDDSALEDDFGDLSSLLDEVAELMNDKETVA